MTSQSFTGDLGGLDGADQKCKQAAQNAGLVRSYKAILSDDTKTALSRLTFVGAVYLFLADGSRSKVSDLGTDLFNDSEDLISPINRDERGSLVANYTWTGTNGNGGNEIDFDNCLNWTSELPGESGTYGQPNERFDAWVENIDGRSCDTQLHLYCISQ